MKRVGIFFLFLLPNLSVCCSHLSLAKALAVVQETKPLSAKMVSEITDCLHESDKQLKGFAAATLSYVPQAKRSVDTLTLLNVSLSTTNVVETLGRLETKRLYRMRADLAFQAGQFAAAAKDYEELEKVSEGPLKEYAVTRLGWSYLNDGRPSIAFHLWASDLIQSDRHRGSRILFQSVGQAYAEAVAQGELHTSELEELPLSEENERALIEGLLEGSESLTSSENIGALSKSLSAFHWYERLTARYFERNADAISGHDACEKLGWFSKPIVNSLPYDPYGKVAVRCARFALSKEKARPIDATILDLIAAISFAGDQNYWPARFLNARGNPKGACESVLSWIEDQREPSENIPIDGFSEFCVSAVSKSTEPEVTQLVERILSSDAPSSFSDKAQPRVFLLVRLLQVERFFKPFIEVALSRKDDLAHTLVPTLLLETSQAKKAPLSPLVGAFARSQRGTKNWEDAILIAFREDVATGDLDSARTLMETHHPRESIKSANESVVLSWLALLIEEHRRVKGSCKEPLSEIAAAKATLSTQRILGEVLELLLKCGNVEVAARAFSQGENVLDSRQSSIFERRFFDAVLLGNWAPRNEDGLSVRLKFAVELAKATAEKDSHLIADLRLNSNSPFFQNAKFLKSAAERADILLDLRKPVKDPALRLQSWVHHIQKSLSSIDRQTWQHKELWRLGRSQLGQFCGEARQLSSSDAMKPSNKELDSQQWGTVLSSIQEQFADCESKAAGGGES